MLPISRTQPSSASTELATEQERGEAASAPRSPGRAGSPLLDALPPRAPRPAATAAPRKLAAHDKQLASYLMGRRIDGREIEGQELARLRQANDVLQETREALPIGRGNVTTDIASSNGNSARTYSAARVVRNSRKLNALPLHRAAIAEIAGAGNCGEHSAVAVHKLAARLSDGQEAHSVFNRSVDHGWAELRTSDPDGRAQPTVVLDAWGEGPAIHAEDGRYASPDIPPEHRVSDYSYDARTAAPALREKAEFHAEHGDAVGARIDVVRKRLSVLGFKQTKTFAPTPAIDPDFADRVREKMDDLHDMTMFSMNLPALESADFRNDLLATSVLRQMGASVREAVGAAREVSRAAGALASAPQNPPRAHPAPQAEATDIQRSVQQTLLELFPSSPSGGEVEAGPSGTRERDPESDAESGARNVRQRTSAGTTPFN